MDQKTSIIISLVKHNKSRVNVQKYFQLTEIPVIQLHLHSWSALTDC